MICPELLRTQAHLDGELDAKARAEVVSHIGACAECSDFAANTRRLSDDIRRDIVRYRAPDSLRGRVHAALDAEAPAHNVVNLGASRRSFWVGAAGGAGVSALAAAFALSVILPPTADTLAQSVANAHTQALMNGQLIQVASSEHHTVKPWFAGRVPVSPPVADFAKLGFPLLGGRVDTVAGARVAVVVYGHGRHKIDLFVWADRGSRLPGQSTTHGYHSIFWKGGDLDFAAVSDTDTAELNKFVHLVRSEPE